MAVMGYETAYLSITVAWLAALLSILAFYLNPKFKLAVPPLWLTEVVVVALILLFACLLYLPPVVEFRS